MKNITNLNKTACNFFVLFFLTVLYFFVSRYKAYNELLGITMILFLWNCIWAMYLRKNGRSLFITFHFLLFVFLFSRPCISVFRGFSWWRVYSYFTSSDVMTVMLILFLTLLSLNVGYFIKIPFFKFSPWKERHFRHRDALKFIFYTGFLITAGASLMLELEKLFYMHGRYYIDYFSQFKSQMPVAFEQFAGLFIYFFCGALMLRPSKRTAYILLTINILIGFPSVLFGRRNPIVLAAVFALVYFFMRDMQRDKTKWIGKFEKKLLLGILPIMILGLGSLNYIRDGEKSAVGSNPIALAGDFFYKQGTTFDTMVQGVHFEKKLTVSKKYYSFGKIIDSVRYGSVAHTIFSVPSIKANSRQEATESHRLANPLSYLVLGNMYLEGHGRGSNYLVELYLDFGLLGVVLFNLLFGAGIRTLKTRISKNDAYFYFVLVSMSSWISSPRDSAFSFLYFIVDMKFYLFLIGTFVLLQIIKSNKRISSFVSFLR